MIQGSSPSGSRGPDTARLWKALHHHLQDTVDLLRRINAPFDAYQPRQDPLRRRITIARLVSWTIGSGTGTECMAARLLSHADTELLASTLP